MAAAIIVYRTFVQNSFFYLSHCFLSQFCISYAKQSLALLKSSQFMALCGAKTRFERQINHEDLIQLAG